MGEMKANEPDHAKTALMSKSPRPASRAWVSILLWSLLGLAVVTAVAYFVLRTGGDEAQTAELAEPLSAPANQSAAATQPKSKAAFEKLVGRWLREDGGYMIEIREVMPDGTLSVEYFNPRPVRVSRAAAVEEGGSVKVGIELNDVGYPGCLYTLVFDSKLDQLQGTYFQAAQGQTYEITFIRMPER